MGGCSFNQKRQGSLALELQEFSKNCLLLPHEGAGQFWVVSKLVAVQYVAFIWVPSPCFHGSFNFFNAMLVWVEEETGNFENETTGMYFAVK